jgi:hypothetical protein
MRAGRFGFCEHIQSALMLARAEQDTSNNRGQDRIRRSNASNTVGISERAAMVTLGDQSGKHRKQALQMPVRATEQFSR